MTLSRREVLLGAAAMAARPSFGFAVPQDPPEPYFTPAEKFRDVSRGDPLPHKLPPEKRAKVGLTQDSWKLQILSDPENKAEIGKAVTLDWGALMKLAETRAVRYPKIMTCNNIARPLGMGLWEGVPLRELIWMTEPKEDLRRVFYYGYHNDDPKQMFRSSLPIGRVLEDPPGMPPVIVCTKLNGQGLTPERGGPVRIVVPEAYGFKSVKWLSHIVLTNLAVANDTYIDGNNDIDSPLKTYARTVAPPQEAKAGQTIRIWGLAQVGVAGLSKVQVWIAPEAEPWPKDDPYFTKAPWKDAEILPPPREWEGKPARWPMPFTKAHWTAELEGLSAGKHVLRCRTIDTNGAAQPMPRPFAKSGRVAIEEVKIEVR